MNSTPALIGMFAILCMLGSSFSYTTYSKSAKRDKKNQVMPMKTVKMKIGGPVGAAAATVDAANTAFAHVAGSG